MAKNKKAGAAYMTALEVASAVQTALRENDEFAELAEVKTLFVYTRKPQTVRGAKVPFTVTKLGGLGSFFAGPTAKEHEWAEPDAQFLVVVFRDAWMLMTPEMQAACSYKILCHMSVENLESGGQRLSIVKPDIEEFTDVVAKYGQNWLPDSVMSMAVNGQPELPVSNEIILPRPANPAKKPKGKIHDKEYEGGHLTG